MSEEVEKKESNEPKKRGRPRKNPVVEENSVKIEKKDIKKETKKEIKKDIKEEIKEKDKKENAKQSKEETSKVKKQGSSKKVSEKDDTIKKDTKKKEVKQEEKKEQKEEKKSKVEKESKEDKKLVVKKNPKDIVISSEKLEKIEEEIKKQKTISNEKKNKINNMIFKNIMIAIVVIIYFIFINLGYYNLEPLKYLKDLQVFSIVTIGITIIIFERAYKKDSGEITIYGIESLIVSICTLMTIYIGTHYKDKFTYIINAIGMLFGVYYVAKSIVIYVKMKRKALKQTSDIHKIGRVK